MCRNYTPNFIFILLLQLFCISVSAQIDMSNRDGRPRPEETPQNIKESIAKQKIEQEKKEYNELRSRAEEALQLSEEIENSFSESNQISSETIKKLERLEKLVKKIRNDLGGDEDAENDVEEEKPNSIQNAFKKLQEATKKLYAEVKKSSRYSISAIAIQSSNAVLKIVKFIRLGK
jgi:membrane-associated HD superfamily phosphohydrolase